MRPSPHRFLSGYRQRQQRNSDKHPLRQGDTHTARQEGSHQHGSVDESNQFVATPRFTNVRPRTADGTSNVQTASSSSFANALRASIRSSEVVEDACGPSQYNESDDEMLDDLRPNSDLRVHDLVNDPANSPRWSNELAFSPKRRRLSTGDELATRAQFKAPPSPSQRATRGAASFTAFGSAAAQTSFSIDAIATQRPTFKRPEITASDTSGPVPEIFSPHRRGQKFIPGGMAASVQQWVLETGQAAVQGRKGQCYLRGEDYVMKLKLEGQVYGDGPFTARAITPEGDRLNVLLTGGHDPQGIRKDDVRDGRILGVRAPAWEVTLDGKVWTVAVDWRLLS